MLWLLNICWLESFQQQSSGGDSMEPGMCNEINIHPSCRTNEEETLKGTILVRARDTVKISDSRNMYAF